MTRLLDIFDLFKLLRFFKCDPLAFAIFTLKSAWLQALAVVYIFKVHCFSAALAHRPTAHATLLASSAADPSSSPSPPMGGLSAPSLALVRLLLVGFATCVNVLGVTKHTGSRF